jgi:hypothetical protein
MTIAPEEILPTDEFLRRWTNQEYLALERQRAADIAADKVGNAKNWDIVTASDVLHINSQKATTLRADLIADGIITPERAEVIFGRHLG